MAKPRTRKNTNAQSVTRPIISLSAVNVSPTDVARRAYDLFLARGCKHGHDLDDWLEAERELNRAPARIGA